MRILALESSCDESAAAYLEVRGREVVRLEHLVASQAVHAKYGGVVPEVAAREHAATVPPLLAALADKVTGEVDGQALGKLVDVVAATRGPGLITSLRVGLDSARTLAAVWDKPLLGVNHMEGHIYANWLPKPGEKDLLDDAGLFPAIVLVVSGGHTEVLLMRGHGRFTLLGATRDDASGEAFDKSAKLMGLGYPGGPALSKLAAHGNRNAVPLPRPMIGDGLDFSFSGLKTAVRYFVEEHRDRLAEDGFRRDLAASVETAIVDVLVAKAIRAARAKKAKSLLVAGGVAANGYLRARLREAAAAELPGTRFIEPQLAYCTDNAAMIAMAAFFRARQARKGVWTKMEPDPNWELGR